MEGASEGSRAVETHGGGTYRVLHNGCCEHHSTRDSTLNFEPTFSR